MYAIIHSRYDHPSIEGTLEKSSIFNVKLRSYFRFKKILTSTPKANIIKPIPAAYLNTGRFEYPST